MSVRASKQEVIDKYWLEFIDFYRQLMKEAKEEEIEMGGEGYSALSGLFDMLSDRDKMVKQAAYLEFKEPTQTNFWKWYALFKIKPTTKVAR